MNPANQPTKLSDPKLIPAWIALAVLLTFGFLPFCQFTAWDDASTLAANPRMNPPSLHNLAFYWRHSDRGLYVPITQTAWSALAAVGQTGLPNGYGSGLRASLFHTANLFLHVVAALLVFRILEWLTKKPWPAFLGALLFALHPVQVEPVAWASGLKDVLCGVLVLAALWHYLLWAEQPNWTRAALATVLFSAAMLSKPTAMVTPLMAWAIDYWILRRPLRRTVLIPAIWCVLAIPVFLITRQAQQVGVIIWTPPHLRPLVAGDALAFYLRHIVWPAHLAVDYTRRPMVILSHRITYIIWLIPAAVALLIFLQRRRPWLVAAGLLFLAPLLPVLGLQPFMMQYTSTVADHYLYLPMFAVALAAACFLSIHEQTRWFTLAALLITTIAIRSALQTRFWKDDETLNRHTLIVSPDSFTAHINLSSDLQSKGDFQGELNECAAAVRCNPSFPLARSNYAKMLATLNHLDEAVEQARTLQKLMSTVPPAGGKTFAPSIDLVGRKLLWHHAPHGAVEMFEIAQQIDPQNMDVQTDLRNAQKQAATRPVQ